MATYLEDLNSTYSGEWSEKFLELYPANDSVTASGAYNSQWTDRSKVGTLLWSQVWPEGASSPVFNYFWDHAPPGQDQGAYHESEINYVLNNLYSTDLPWAAEVSTFEPGEGLVASIKPSELMFYCLFQDYEIASMMNAYWVNFIKSGNPNGGNLTYWPKVDPENQTVQHVGDGWGQVHVASKAKVELFKDWFDTIIAV